MQTHTFTLPSGVEAEATSLMAKHQRLLTERGANNFAGNLNKVLADVIVRVGSDNNITEDFVLNMLEKDKKFALVQIRQFTLDFPEKFEFNFDYKSQNGIKESKLFDIDISGGFNVVPLKVIDGDTVKNADYKEYADIQRQIEFVLPKSKNKVRIKLLDGKGELIAANTPKSKLSSHTAIEMRSPQIETETSKGGKIWMVLDLDGLSIIDIEYIRATIKELEGSVDTEFMFEHPEADFKSVGERDITIDLLTQLNFFFPSGAT